MPRTLNIINILLGIILIAFLANITADRFSLRLSGLTRAKGVNTSQPVSATGSKIENLDFYAPILTNGLFGKATQGQLTAVVNAPALAQQAAPTVAPSDLLLLGTVVGSFRETFALVRSNSKQEERVFRLGDLVFDAGRLAQVTKEQAYIVINGKRVELLTPMSPPPAAMPAQPQQPATRMAVTSTGGGNFVIDQRALNAALDNPAQAMTDARLLPSQKDGKIEGFKVTEVKPSGLFAMIGIKNSDVLLRLNDFPMDSPDKALQSLIALKGQSRLKLDLIRDGQPATFNYDIR